MYIFFFILKFAYLKNERLFELFVVQVYCIKLPFFTVIIKIDYHATVYS